MKYGLAIDSATIAPAVPSSSPVPCRWRTLATAERLAVMLDLDGTLIEFAPTPERAVLDGSAIDLCQRLLAAGIQVVMVSGRPSESIDRMRPLIPGAWWAAEHGSWRWTSELVAQPATTAPELDDLATRLDTVITVPGTLIERKSLSLCVHWRRVEPAARTELIAAIALACDQWLEERPTFECLAGVEMLEVRQRSVHKGVAVSWVRDQLPGVRILAIGDDATDEDMFAELDAGDASVSVGPRVMHSDAHATDVSAVRAFLRWVDDTRAGRELPLPIRPAVEPAPRKRHGFVVLSNRTPAVTQGRTREVGGLVSALEPALRDENGIWLGWSGQERGQTSRIVIDTSAHPPRARFDLPAAVRQHFYAGFCNSVLWPLFHGFPTRVRVSEGDWDAYVRANERYARHAIELAQRDAIIWVHDYHLLLAARALRSLGHRGRIGMFLHIPFPSRDILETIPWAGALVDAMLDFDVLGFQTQQSAMNFQTAAQALAGATCDDTSVQRGDHTAAIGVFPATIYPEPFREVTEEVPEIASLRHILGERRLILGVDRLDYSKGIPERLDAYERMLERHPEWRSRVAFVQISVPSRAEIPEYAELRHQVEAMVGRINGRFGDIDWVPVRYLYRSYDARVLAQLYRVADVALVTPLRDGMNLVAKEFVAAQDPARPGALVLSQYAGAAETLTSAILTNPFFADGLATDIERALSMPLDERIERHRLMVDALDREGDAKAWAQKFLDQLAPRRLHAVG